MLETGRNAITLVVQQLAKMSGTYIHSARQKHIRKSAYTYPTGMLSRTSLVSHRSCLKLCVVFQAATKLSLKSSIDRASVNGRYTGNITAKSHGATTRWSNISNCHIIRYIKQVIN